MRRDLRAQIAVLSFTYEVLELLAADTTISIPISPSSKHNTAIVPHTGMIGYPSAHDTAPGSSPRLQTAQLTLSQ